jgi:hypothetical protein
MSYPEWAPDPQLDQQQPDGNFNDEPPTEEEIEAQRRSERLDQERAANRQGPSHPAHFQHAQWLAERGIGPEWDTRTSR